MSRSKNLVIGFERRRELLELELERQLVRSRQPHHPVEREVHPRAQRAGFAEGERHFAAQPPVSGLAAYVQHVHQQRSRIRMLRSMRMDRLDQCGIRFFKHKYSQQKILFPSHKDTKKPDGCKTESHRSGADRRVVAAAPKIRKPDPESQPAVPVPRDTKRGGPAQALLRNR